MCSAMHAITSIEVSSLTSEVHHPSQSWPRSLFRNIISLTIFSKKRGDSGRFTLSSRGAFPPSSEGSLCRRRGDRPWLRAFKAGNRWWRLPHIGRYDDGTAPCSPKLRGGNCVFWGRQQMHFCFLDLGCSLHRAEVSWVVR